MKALHLTDNDYMQKANVEFVEESLPAPARVLTPPSFIFGNRETANPRPEDCTWRGRQFFQFFRTVNIGSDWAAFLFTGKLQCDRITVDDFQ